MCKEILYQEGAIGRSGNIDHVSYFPNREDGPDFISIELRRYDTDTILQARVYVDGDMVIDSREILDNYLDTAGNIRKAIAKFDELLENHPMSWKRTPVETTEEDLPF